MILKKFYYFYLWFIDFCCITIIIGLMIFSLVNVNLLSLFIAAIYASSFTVDYVYFTARTPLIICSRNGCMSYVIKQSLEEPHKLYLPNVFLLKPFQQTFGGPIVRHYNSFSIKYEREQFRLSDGEVIALDWYCGEPLFRFEQEDIKPIALFVADVREDIQSPDLKLMIPMAFESGYRCVVLNYRGCGNMKLKYPRLVSLYDVQDTEEVVNYLKSKTNAFKCLVAIGFGFGGNQIINYLIKIGDQSKIDVAILISITFDFNHMHNNLKKSYLGRAISAQTVNYFKYIINNNESTFRNSLSFDINEVTSSKFIPDFDSNYTIRIHNYFSSLEQFYEQFSAKGKLNNIKVPVLLINSKDDPMSTDIPLDEIRQTNGITLVITSVGGHKGFIERLYPPFFTERIIDEFLVALFTLSNNMDTIRFYLRDNSTIGFV